MAWDGYPGKKWLAHPGEFWLGMILLVVCWMAAGVLLRNVALTRPSSVAVGLLPTLPMLMMMRGYLRMHREQDELHRSVQVEATAVATCLTIVFCFSAWFLAAFAATPPVDIQWAGIVLFFSYAIATGVLMRRYS